MSEPEVALQVEGLTAGYGGVPVIKGVGITARRGWITVLVGPNGAGKSTLLKTIAGIVRPLEGRILIGQEDVTRVAASKLVAKGLGYVPQVKNVFPSLTVMENLEMGGYTLGSGVRKRAEELCELFPDLKAALKRPARTLSGGQRNMLGMARGLMCEPKVLLIDEPTAGLSPKYEEVVWQHVAAVRDTGVAVLVVEQNTRRALTHADWGYVLVLGENRLEGTGAELLKNPEIGDLYIGKAGGTAHQPGHLGVNA